MNEQPLLPTFSNAAFPLGTIIPYAGDIDVENRARLAEKGWLLCDGAPISRIDYSELYKAVGDIHGAGDFRSTFNLPDYRGIFLRGANLGSGRDPDAETRYPAHEGGRGKDNVGSVQDDTFKQHSHNFTGATQVEVNRSGKWVPSVVNDRGQPQATTALGGSETRPKNASVVWLILAK
jgi:microcystin-dependent protein